METQVLENPMVEVNTKREIVLITKTDADILAVKKIALAIKVMGPTDKAGYEAAKKLRLEVRDMRLIVDKTHKEVKEESLKYGKKCDAEKNRLLALLEPIESYLASQEKIVTDEEERLKAEKQRLLEEKIKARQQAFANVHSPVTYTDVLLMTDEVYEAKLAEDTEKETVRLKDIADQAAKLEEQRIAQEAQQKVLDDQRAERERITAEAQAIIATRQAELAAEQKLIDEANAEISRVKREEELAKEAAEDALAKKAEEDKAATELAQKEEANRLAIEAAAPDADKILKFSKEVENLSIPQMNSEAGKLAEKDLRFILVRAAQSIVTLSNLVSTNKIHEAQ